MAQEPSYKRRLSEDLYEEDSDSEKSRSPHKRSCHDLDPEDLEEQRLKVNLRERDRMHDMNGALDSLRAVMPYAQGPSVKKLSKMNTLLLARNYILLLNRSIEDTKRLLAEGYHTAALTHRSAVLTSGHVPAAASHLEPYLSGGPACVLPPRAVVSPCAVRGLAGTGLLCPSILSRDQHRLVAPHLGRPHTVLSCACAACHHLP